MTTRPDTATTAGQADPSGTIGVAAPDTATAPGAAGRTESPGNEGAVPGQPHPSPRPFSPLGGPLGSMVGTHTVRDAVESTFTARVGSYLAEAGRQNPQITNPGLAGFHDWVNQPGAGTVNPANAPRYVILTPGTLGAPYRRGDGSYSVTWLVRIQLWLWGKAWRDCDDRLGAYLAATRVCLLQNPSLGGVAKSVTWRGETVAPVAQLGTHTWGQATLEVAVYCDPVAHASAGPAPLDPTVLPVGALPVTGSHVSVTGIPAV